MSIKLVTTPQTRLHNHTDNSLIQKIILSSPWSVIVLQFPSTFFGISILYHHFLQYKILHGGKFPRCRTEINTMFINFLHILDIDFVYFSYIGVDDLSFIIAIFPAFLIIFFAFVSYIHVISSTI